MGRQRGEEGGERRETTKKKDQEVQVQFVNCIVPSRWKTSTGFKKNRPGGGWGKRGKEMESSECVRNSAFRSNECYTMGKNMWNKDQGEVKKGQ